MKVSSSAVPLPQYTKPFLNFFHCIDRRRKNIYGGSICSENFFAKWHVYNRCIIHDQKDVRHMCNSFSTLISTIIFNVCYFGKQIHRSVDNCKVRLQIWDTAGQGTFWLFSYTDDVQPWVICYVKMPNIPHHGIIVLIILVF